MKLKTHKALAKRVKFTKRGKALKRKAGQDHFNSRATGKVRRNKRSDMPMTKSVRKAMDALLPYHK